MVTRILLSLTSFIALFILPWPVALLCMFASALLVPPLGLALGLIADLVYFTPGSAFLPYMSLWGLGCTLLALLVHRFVKTRIITE